MEKVGSAPMKRAEQLRRWEESETCRESPTINLEHRSIKFMDGCVFLAACAAGDKDEVRMLLRKGADVDTANVDGLTGLHQACIDDNLDMVEFLVENKADINRGDNEGWTPLHVTASCGFLSIAKYLIEKGADIAAVNNDGDLPIDIVESDDLEELLQNEINKQGIDCESARHEEEHIMLIDAKQWLNGTVGYKEVAHHKTGATSLHVAAAKGYIKVMSLLLQLGVDVNAQDCDGWTPLHAAAHWAQREACEMLAEALCNMDIRNYVGQTAFDVAEPDIVNLLEELKKKQATLRRDKPEIQTVLTKRPAPPSRRSREDKARGEEANGIELNLESSVTRMSGSDKSSLISKDVEDERKQLLHGTSILEENKLAPIAKLESELQPAEMDVEKILNAVNTQKSDKPVSLQEAEIKQAPVFVPKPPVETEDLNSWRRPGNIRTNRTGEVPSEEEEKANAKRRLEADAVSAAQLKRAYTFESDTRNEEPKTGDNEAQPVRRTATSDWSKYSPGTIFTRIFKSFVPPVRDDESETQRKAHAKRVRETRRSTQGVTLEDLKSAQQYMKQQQQQQSKQVTNSPESPLTAEETPVVSQERRPSWRLRQEQNDKTKFTLEDARETKLPPRVPTSPDQDSESDPRNSTEAAIQRRRKPKRRSTGVVQPDHVEEAEAEKRSDNRVSSTASSRAPSEGRSSRATSVNSQENGEIDYKKLYQESVADNERLKEQLTRAQTELKDARSQLDTALQQNNSRNMLSDSEKREKRALERKLSEMEEELRQLQKLKAENEKLKAENRALTRVVSKLTAASKMNLNDPPDDEA